MRTGNREAVRDAYRRALTVPSARADDLRSIRLRLADLELEMGHVAEASSTLEEALAGAPTAADDSAPRLKLASLLRAQKRWDEAAAHLSAAYAKGDGPELAIELAYTRKAQGRPAEAIAVLERAYEQASAMDLRKRILDELGFLHEGQREP